jgi:hypothetical protein
MGNGDGFIAVIESRLFLRADQMSERKPHHYQP